MEAVLVRVEVNVASGLPSMAVVGLPQSAVREGTERVRAAIQNAGYSLAPRRVTVNLAPADVKKEGSGFDLPLALGLLSGGGHIPRDALAGTAFLGELGLNGELRPVRGALAVALACERAEVPRLVVPLPNAGEAAAGAKRVEVFGAGSLQAVVRHLRREGDLPRAEVDVGDVLSGPCPSDADLSDVRGHVGIKRALEIAAAGGHNVLMAGPPGSGKTMLARRLPGILPPLTAEEALEVTAVHSVAGLLPPHDALVRRRPFRAPHQSISTAGLIGGGPRLRPGEVSLAHRGVLFLDEMAEYPRNVLETLRQPMEDGSVTLIRAKERVCLPARFVLVAATNPCPCGHLGDPRRACTCDPNVVARYQSRVSAPLRDRIDLHLTVGIVPFRELHDAAASETSASVRERVMEARCRQAFRRGTVAASPARVPVWNSGLGQREIQTWCRPTPDGALLLEDASDRLSLSSRGVHRVLKVARTIADLEGRAGVDEHHVAEALQYRPGEP